MLGTLFRKPTARRLGNRARDKGRWADAANHYRRHLDETPDDFAIWVQLGHMLTELGDYPGADAAYGHAAEIEPDNSDLLLCWARSRRRAGEARRARDLYGLRLARDGNAHAANEIAEMDAEAATTPAVEVPAAPAPPPPAWAARMETLKPFRMTPGQEVALFVTHSATGRIKPHVGPYLDALVTAGIAT